MTPKRVKKIRVSLGLSQPALAELLRVAVGTVRDWEQGRNAPSGPAELLLELAERGVLKSKE